MGLCAGPCGRPCCTSATSDARPVSDPRASGRAADATRFDDSPEILPDGRITNAEMRRDAAALRAALARSDLAPRLDARLWELPSRGAGAAGSETGAPTVQEAGAAKRSLASQLWSPLERPAHTPPAVPPRQEPDATARSRPGRDRSRSLPRTPVGLRNAPDGSLSPAAVTQPQPLQTTLHQWGLWHGDANAYKLHRARQLRDHAAVGGSVAAHALGDIHVGGNRGDGGRLQGLPPRDAMHP
eukprot:7583242-Alexandrium_andersonii.AAC.1